jgi:hypothetical protein
MTAARPLNGKAGFVPDQGNGYECVVDVQKSKTATAYEPLQLVHTARSYAIHWLVFPYSLQHARKVYPDRWTFQVQLCATGGGNTWNEWNQYFDGLGFALATSSPKMIGWDWASKVANGKLSATLNFQVNLGIVSIGGTDTVNSYGTHAGNPGANSDIGWPHGWNKYDGNRMNTYYVSAHTFYFQGTPYFEGNVGHALYEFVTGGTVGFGIGATSTIMAQCHRIVGSCVNFA